jgi:hypothetical protein
VSDECKIVITLDESLTVGAYIEGVPSPNQRQCRALRDLVELAAQLRGSLTYQEVTDD